MPFRPALIALLLTASAGAETTLARIFADHMVLQRGEPVAVFGHDNPGEKIQLKFGEQTQSATASQDGSWQVDLDPLKANASSRDLTVSGSTTVTLSDVLVGEVWLAAGQSNMNFQVKSCSTKPHPENFPLIRMANW